MARFSSIKVNSILINSSNTVGIKVQFGKCAKTLKKTDQCFHIIRGIRSWSRQSFTDSNVLRRKRGLVAVVICHQESQRCVRFNKIKQFFRKCLSIQRVFAFIGIRLWTAAADE